MNALASDRLPSPDDLIAGKYRVRRVIAEGGMGVVVEAQHVRLDRPVALKLLRPNVRVDAEVAARFEREARAAARITGPHVARVIDVDSAEDGSPFMVMELLRGHDLSAELSRRGRLEPNEAVAFVLQACTAMREAHALGIVHRDLKPSNLFLCDVTDGPRAIKVLDFGISKATTLDDVAMTATHAVLGTPLYMSPEQVRSARKVDARSDIWSLGVILYELLAGQPPFTGRSATAIAAAIAADPPEPLCALRSDVPPGLAAVIHKALEKNPDDRFPDIDAFVAALAPWGPTAEAAGSAAAAPARQSSRAWLGALVAGAVLLLAAAWLLHRRANDPALQTISPVAQPAVSAEPAPTSPPSAVALPAAPPPSSSAPATVVSATQPATRPGHRPATPVTAAPAAPSAPAVTTVVAPADNPLHL